MTTWVDYVCPKPQTKENVYVYYDGFSSYQTNPF